MLTPALAVVLLLVWFGMLRSANGSYPHLKALDGAGGQLRGYPTIDEPR